MTDPVYPLPKITREEFLAHLETHKNNPGSHTLLPANFPLNQQIRALIGKKIEIGSDGFIELVDYMGSDASICNAARTSYGNHRKEFADAKDEALIRRLMRDRHTTPYEMASIIFLVRCPMDLWRQWIRHRTAKVSEYSTRYRDAIDSRATTDPLDWRLQAKKNKQGSDGYLSGWPEGWGFDPVHRLVFGPPAPGTDLARTWGTKGIKVDNIGEFLSLMEHFYHTDGDFTYKLRLELGVAREQARKDLPLSTYTEAYWKCDLHNILHFLGLRMEGHAQKEIRDYANVMGREFIAQLFPHAWNAFIDYQFNGVTFSGPEQLCIIRNVNLMHDVADGNQYAKPTLSAEIIANTLITDSADERDQFEYKLARIGFRSAKYDGSPPYTE